MNEKTNEWSELDDESLVPSGKTARELDRAHTDTAAGLGLGVRRSAQKVINQVAMFKCDACGGSGRFIRGFNYVRDYGPCNKCKGTGKLRTDPETRAKARAANAARKVKLKIEALEAFKAAHPAEWAWIDAKKDRLSFAQAMAGALDRYGELTVNQLAAIQRCIEGDKTRAEQHAAKVATAPNVAGAGFSRMVAAFDAAKASGLKNPKFRVQHYAFKPAKPGSTNAGCIYVTRDDTYLGKITSNGQYLASRDADAQTQAQVADICKDPFAAAVLHGQQTGRCSCCGAELTNKESIELGIGPICRRKWGL